jgi:hypothetical protein
MDVNSKQQRIEELVMAIIDLQADLDRLSGVFREDIESADSANFDKWSGQDWCRNAFGNALVRLRQLTEQNFRLIETMGLLAVARYVFELSVWLHLFQADSRFGLIYYRQLLDTQLRYYRDTAAHLHREVELLKTFENRERQSTGAVLNNVISKEELISDIKTSIGQAMSAVDAEASRRFSLYLDDAKINGYGFQAHLVEKKAIPQVEQAVRQIEMEMALFEKRVPEETQVLASKRWEWRKMAEKVGLTTEYDYIYCYASKLLHATPASLTTDQKNLEVREVYIFVRYIYSKLLEIVALAQQRPEYRQRTGA